MAIATEPTTVTARLEELQQASERASQRVRQRVRVPSAPAFDGADFLADPALDAIGMALVAKVEAFEVLGRAEILYRWKRKGGARGGKPILGKCQKPSGLLKHFSAADFVIWLAADHCAERRLGATELEALVFHELSHAGWESEDDDEDEEEAIGADGAGRWVLRPHDVEAFGSEVRRYGLWHEDLQALGDTIRQLPLFGEGAGRPV